MQKELTVTFSPVLSSTKPELSAPILNVPPEISIIPGGQGLTVTANTDELVNSDISATT
ncbi:MAG: hypothetical protein PT118_16890 [Aphanizomenon gracile PMC644.10]|nr:hypothetical protein [Aphanizomenon gracile PMC644.10]